MALADKNTGLHKVMPAKRNSQLPKGKISSEELQRRGKKILAKDLRCTLKIKLCRKGFIHFVMLRLGLSGLLQVKAP